LYGTRSFITAFTRVLHWCPSWESTATHHTTAIICVWTAASYYSSYKPPLRYHSGEPLHREREDSRLSTQLTCPWRFHASLRWWKGSRDGRKPRRGSNIYWVRKEKGTHELTQLYDTDVTGKMAEGRPQCGTDVTGKMAEGPLQCGTDVTQGHPYFNCRMNWLVCNKNNNTKYIHNKK
jgi:hypothetical protein